MPPFSRLSIPFDDLADYSKPVQPWTDWEPYDWTDDWTKKAMRALQLPGEALGVSAAGYQMLSNLAADELPAWLDAAGAGGLLSEDVKRAWRNDAQRAPKIRLASPPAASPALEQLFRRPSAAVLVAGEEGRETLGPQASGALGRRVALDEGERDDRIDVGEDRNGPRPVALQQRAELVREADPFGNEVVASAHHRAQGPDLVRERSQRLEAMAVRTEQIGEQIGIAGVALGVHGRVARAAGLHDVRVDGNDDEAFIDQRVDEQPTRALDGYAQLARFCKALQSSGERRQAFTIVPCFESVDDLTASA